MHLLPVGNAAQFCGMIRSMCARRCHRFHAKLTSVMAAADQAKSVVHLIPVWSFNILAKGVMLLLAFGASSESVAEQP